MMRLVTVGSVRRLFTLADLSPFPNRPPGAQTYHEQKVFPYVIFLFFVLELNLLCM
jgi:hypothetical protein